MRFNVAKRRALLAVLAAGAACENVDTGVEPAEGADMSKFVAMGTSITMGFASDGVVSTTQNNSWAKLLANDVGVTFTVPSIDAPGCRPPFAAPLGQLRRTDGTSLLTPSTVCAANSAGVLLPTQNVAVAGHTAGDAVNATVNAGTVGARVLVSGQTQVNAMRSQAPTFVAVEFGASDMLQAISGLVSTATVTPFSAFSASYQSIIDAVKQQNAQAVLTLLPVDVAKYPVLRTSAEVASQRTAFATLNVNVNADCDGSTNMISLLKILGAILSGSLSAGVGPFNLSCADVAGTADGVLTPADIASLNTLAAQMNAFIATKASENGYATFSLGALYDTAKDGISFNLATILTSNTPFGPGISLDAVHPSAVGQATLMAAAKAAIIARYGSISK